MSNKIISIKTPDAEEMLADDKIDRGLKVSKLLAQLVPCGGLLHDLVTTVIPDQKTDRVVDFLKILNYKLSLIETEVEEQKLRSEKFTDLLEDAIAQAARALTPERREYLASLLAHSLSNEQLEHVEEKKLLDLLNQLNDAEVIWLKSYEFARKAIGDTKRVEFFAKHKAILEPVPRNTIYRYEPEEIKTKKAFVKSYRDKLLALGLIGERFNDADDDRKQKKFDKDTGKLRAAGHFVTRLGSLLLEYIGFTRDEA